MSVAKLIVDLPDCRIYQGRADTWEGDEPVDLVFTNPYGALPASLLYAPKILHQWVHRRTELEAWCGTTRLHLVGLWNGGREAFWSTGFVMDPIDLSEFKPEPGGWYPPAMVLRLLRAVDIRERLAADVPFTIWDGFMGRGTVGQVARALGMHYVGVEELPAHIDLAREYLGV